MLEEAPRDSLRVLRRCGGALSRRALMLIGSARECESRVVAAETWLYVVHIDHSLTQYYVVHYSVVFDASIMSKK